METNKTISIKKFVNEYAKRVPQMQETYIKENLVITPYVPFVKKDALADKLVDISTYVFEDYTKEDGTTGRRKTDKIKVNSTVQYLLFCRLVIENYTNLTVETEGFFEEYDALKECGLLDKLMVSTENRPSLIPMDEIAELRVIIDMKQKDAIFNATEIHNYIGSQVERFSSVLSVGIAPILNKIAKEIETLDENKINKLEKSVERIVKKFK